MRLAPGDVRPLLTSPLKKSFGKEKPGFSLLPLTGSCGK